MNMNNDKALTLVDANTDFEALQQSKQEMDAWTATIKWAEINESQRLEYTACIKEFADEYRHESKRLIQLVDEQSAQSNQTSLQLINTVNDISARGSKDSVSAVVNNLESGESITISKTSKSSLAQDLALYAFLGGIAYMLVYVITH